MTTKIFFNGQEYSSVEDMPPDVRQAYEQMMGMFVDKNANGLPDAFEGMLQARGVSLENMHFNGQAYGSLEEMPPEVRQAYEKAMSALNRLGDNNQNGVPDVIENALSMRSASIAMFQHNLPEGATVQAHLTPTAPMPVASAMPAPAANPQPVISGGVESSERNLRLLII